jgi:GntR family transcriptional regulator, transcriptional repressor for pyruvate dehydrogenase complex
VPSPTGAGTGAADGAPRLVYHAPLSEPVQVASATSEVTDRLLAAIAIGEFLPGERLPAERALAKMLGVARSTVHDALHRLRDAGVVEIYLGRSGGAVIRSDWTPDSAGAVARTLSVQRPQLGELFDMRRLVEGMIARAAAERRTSQDVRQLRAALEEFGAVEEMIEARAIDRRLHGLVTAAARNPHLTSLGANLTAAATLGFGAEPYAPEFLAQARAEHQELVDRIAEGNAEAAGRCAQEHFALTLESMRAGLRKARDARRN